MTATPPPILSMDGVDTYRGPRRVLVDVCAY